MYLVFYTRVLSQTVFVIRLISGVKELLFFPDLVPKDNIEKWLKYLRKEFPTVAFKSATMTKDKTMVRVLQPAPWESYVFAVIHVQTSLKFLFPWFDCTSVSDGCAFTLWLSFAVQWGNSYHCSYSRWINLSIHILSSLMMMGFFAFESYSRNRSQKDMHVLISQKPVSISEANAFWNFSKSMARPKTKPFRLE